MVVKSVTMASMEVVQKQGWYPRKEEARGEEVALALS